MSGTQPIGNRFNMKLEMLEIERFYDQRSPSDEHRCQRVACERYRRQTVSVIRIVVRGFALATH